MNYKEYLLELKKYSPYDFSEYSDNSIQRRIAKIMEDYCLTMEELLEKTKTDSTFVEQLVNDITVNTTDFFRDPELWLEYLNTILTKYKNKPQVTMWHAGASTGQEVFSNIILLNEKELLKKSKIYATDINRFVLEEAKNGVYRYSSNIKTIEAFCSLFKNNQTIDCSESAILSKYFIYENERDHLKINTDIKEIPFFKKHDLVQESIPFNVKFDVIFCRNVLIYFNTGLQTKILKMFYDNMNPGGILILGNNEGLSGFFKTKFVKHGNFFTKSNAFHFKS